VSDDTGRPVSDLRRYVADHTKDYTDREWIYEDVDAWLGKADGPRIYHLSGKPGSGKTAIAARLAQFAAREAEPPADLEHLGPQFLSAIHFCSTRTPAWTNPFEFTQSIASQLASRYPVYRDALTETQLGEGPRQTRNVHVEQTVREVRGGQVVGVVVKVSAPTPEDAFMRVVRSPLRALPGVTARQVVLLVDGLDESLIYSGKTGIIKLLAQLVGDQTGVRLLLTSRFETETAPRFLRTDQARTQTLSAGIGEKRSLLDIERHVLHVLRRGGKHRTLAAKLAPDLSARDFAEHLRDASEGNFLYVRYMLPMLEAKTGRITQASLDALPTGLDATYKEFLGRLIQPTDSEWRTTYRPVLGTLAVAREPLNESQLSHIAGLAQADTRIILIELRQFLDVDPSSLETSRRYAIYHRSFADFLLDAERAGGYWCEEQLQHERIAEHLKGFAGDWSKCDAYSLEYAAHHLIQAGRAEDLDLIITKSFSEASGQRLRWHMPFVRNLEQALDVIEPERAARLCLDILTGRQPNSLVNQRIVYLLAYIIRPALQQKGSPFGDPKSSRDRMIDQALGLLTAEPPEVEELINLIGEASGPVRGVIYLALGATKSQEATPVLFDALQKEEGRIAWCVADGLLDLDDRSLIPRLMALYDDPDTTWGTQQRILYVLGRMRATEARGLIQKGLQHPYVYAKAHAVNMLYLLAPVDGAEEILWEKLGFSDKGPEHDSEPVWKSEYLQHRMVTALGRVGTRRSIDHLVHFKREILPNRSPPETDAKRRERQRLEQSVDRAIHGLERREAGESPT